MEYVYIGLQLLLILISFAYAAYLVETNLFMRNKRRMIYCSSNITEQGPILAALIEKYQADGPDIAFVELGAGLARMARYIKKKRSWSRVEAVEVGPVIYAAGWLRNTVMRSGIVFRRADIFSLRFPAKAVLYCYLSKNIITELHRSKALDGCFVVSLTFAIEGLEPTEKIEFKGWQSHFYVYDLRSASH